MFDVERKGGIGRGGENEKGVNDSWVDSVRNEAVDVDDVVDHAVGDVDDVFDDVDVFDVVVVVFDDDDDDDVVVVLVLT